MATGDIEGRWVDLEAIINRTGPLAGPDFEPDTKENPKTKKFLREGSKILIIGAGGLGCELLKNLALSGFVNIDIIDMDTIDVSNLNRQFLFRHSDVGKPKAEAAAAFINKRVPGVKVTPYCCRIEEKDDEYYSQFNLIIAGLDNIIARRWINTKLISMVDVDSDGNIDTDTIIPLIDGGTEGFKGQARVILPRVTSCFECSLDLFPPQQKFQICTIASTPRTAAHCAEYARVIAWEKEWPFGEGVKVDTDEPQHMKWLFDTAKGWADKHNISGLSYRNCLGGVKNIIPAIAATNALIAAACTNEALKYATNASGYINNYMMYNGVSGIYTYTFEHQPKGDCPVCGNPSVTKEVSPDLLLEELMENLRNDPNLQLSRPSLTCDKKVLFMQAPEFLREKTKDNLKKSLRELEIKSGDLLSITDPALPSVALEVTVNYI